MKRLIPLLLIFQAITTISFAQPKMEEPQMKWSFLEINEIILSEFPEAYPDFLKISFKRMGGEVLPESASFYIPSSYFEKGLDITVVENRAKNVMQRMGGAAASGCWDISISGDKKFSWYKWDEKTVKQITLTFGIYC